MNKISITALMAALLLPMTVFAGLDDPGTVGSNMPTTDQIYNLLNAGADILVPDAGTFHEPAAGPTAGARKTLTEIKTVLPIPDTINGAARGDVLAPKTFWGLRNDGTWGVKTGTLILPTAATGTATVANVLKDLTFSNASAVGLTGTMPNNGALSITPGTSAQTIAAGYHNGSGSVAGDTNLDKCNIRAGVTIFGVTGKPYPPATGQTTSYAAGDNGTYQYGCTPVVEPVKTSATLGAGYTRASMGWTSANGSGFTDNSNGTVTDNITGLMWTTNAYLPNVSMPWQGALDYVAGMNSGAGTYGYTDWRLPNINELRTLIDPFRDIYPYLPLSHPFTFVQNAFYWSSTTYAPNSNSAWGVTMYSGGVSYLIKTGTYTYYVWPVRGGQ